MLEHITYQTCPTCTAKIDAAKKYSLHCNGHWNEELRFQCGATFHFIPNFMRVEQTHSCNKEMVKIKKDISYLFKCLKCQHSTSIACDLSGSREFLQCKCGTLYQVEHYGWESIILTVYKSIPNVTLPHSFRLL